MCNDCGIKARRSNGTANVLWHINAWQQVTITHGRCQRCRAFAGPIDPQFLRILRQTYKG